MHIAQIEITCDSVSFQITLPSKIMVCSGESGAGKTWLCSLLPGWARANNAYVLLPRTQGELDLAYHASEALVVIDRADMFKLDIEQMLQDTNQYLLFGHGHYNLPQSTRSIVVDKGDIIQNVCIR